jgi:hypothetical protein
MQTRHRAAATALLLTATAGLAASGATAQAAGTHQTQARAATSLTVKVMSTKNGPKLSVQRIRPGFTTFTFVHKSGKAAQLEIVRLKSGYSLRHLLSDIPKLLGEPTHKLIHRVDNKVVFYGGGDVAAQGTTRTKIAVDIDRSGTYYAVKVGKHPSAVALKARGSHQKRTHPQADGILTIGAGNTWEPKGTLPHKGWIKTSNKAEEPHFIDFMPVADSATDQDVADWFGNPSGPPTWFDGARAQFEFGTEVVSPGHTVYWQARGDAGRFAIACFYPSLHGGMPHAFMGMYLVVTLD